MNKPFVFEKPIGFHDILPAELRRKRALEERILSLMERWGYEQIETPTLEFYDTLGQMSKTEEGKLYKVLDQLGRTLILRPEMTTPIARVTASLLKRDPFPIRLMYAGNVYRTPGKEAGKSAEFTQMGAELIGEEGLHADVEEIALAIEAMKAVGVTSFRIAISHAMLLDAFLAEHLSDPMLVAELKRALGEKNQVGYREKVEEGIDSAKKRDVLLSILRWHGGIEALRDAERYMKSEQTIKHIEELKAINALLSQLGYGDYFIFDLTMRAKQGYYTGIFFEGFAEGVASSILNGGRYDHLLQDFGRKAPATGFAIKVNRLMEIASLSPVRRGKGLLLYPSGLVAETFRFAAEKREEGVILSLHCIGDEEEGIISPNLLKEWEAGYGQILLMTNKGVRVLTGESRKAD